MASARELNMKAKIPSLQALRDYSFVAYGVRWIRNTKYCVIAGGGGLEIPDRIIIAERESSSGEKLVTVCETAMKGTPWSMAVNEKENLIAVCTILKGKTKLQLVEILTFKDEKSKEEKIQALELKAAVDTYSNEEDVGKQFCCFVPNTNKLITCDDHFNVLVYSYHKDKESITLKLETELKGHSKAFTGIDACTTTEQIKEGETTTTKSTSYVVSAAEDKTLKLWNLENNECIVSFDIPNKQKHPRHEFKACIFSSDGKHVYALHTGYGGPAYLTKFNVASKTVESTVILNAKPCSSMTISKPPVADVGDFVVFGVNDGIGVKDLSRLKTYLNAPNVHSLAVSCLDAQVVEQEGKKKLIIAAGSIEKSVSVYEVDTAKKQGLLSFNLIMAVIVLLIAYLCYTFQLYKK